MRAARTAWMLDGSAALPFSAPTATSCSRKSGLPSASSTICAAVCAPSSAAPALSTSSRASAFESASETTSDLFGCGVTQAGRVSTNSGRVLQTSRIGCAARERDQVLEQVEQGRLGPVDVLDDQHERALGGDPLEQPAHGPEGLLGLGRPSARPTAPSTSRAIGSSPSSSSSIAPAADRSRRAAATTSASGR